MAILVLSGVASSADLVWYGVCMPTTVSTLMTCARTNLRTYPLKGTLNNFFIEIIFIFKYYGVFGNYNENLT